MYKVIFADDEIHVIEGLNILVDWKDIGFEVVGTAEDGETTFELIKKYEPDVVIADINMPSLNGLELLEKCLRELEDMPEIIMLTGYDEMEYIKRAMKNGASGYLLKPLNSEEIIEHVLLALKKRAKKKETENEFEEQAEQAAQDLFSQIVYGNYTQSRINRMRFMLDMDDSEDCVSLMVVSVKDDKVIEEIRTVECVKKYSVFDMGFLFVGILTAKKSESELYDLADAILRKAGVEYIVIITPRQPEQLVSAVKRVIEKGQSGGYTEKINSCYNECELSNAENYGECDVDKIKALIDKGKVDEALAEMNEQFGMLLNNGDGMQRIRGFVSAALYEVYKYAQRTGMNMGDDFNLFSYKLALAQRREDIHDAYIELFEKFKLSNEMQKTQPDCKKLLDYIEKNYMNDITLADVSKLAYIKPTAASKMIKRATGMKFNDYINKLRMEEACRLLVRTDNAIVDIATMLGYKDYSYFSIKFKDYMGVLPSQYRKRVYTRHEQFHSHKDNK